MHSPQVLCSTYTLGCLTAPPVGCCTPGIQDNGAPAGKAEPVKSESLSSRRYTWLAAQLQLPRQAWLAQGTGSWPEPAGPGPVSWGQGNMGPRAECPSPQLISKHLGSGKRLTWNVTGLKQLPPPESLGNMISLLQGMGLEPAVSSNPVSLASLGVQT